MTGRSPIESANPSEWAVRHLPVTSLCDANRPDIGNGSCTLRWHKTAQKDTDRSVRARAKHSVQNFPVMPTLVCRRFVLLFWSAALADKATAWWPDYSCRGLDCRSSSSAASHRKSCRGGATSSVHVLHLPVSVVCRAVPTDSDGDDVCRETLGAALGKMVAVTESGFASRFNQRRMNSVEVRQSSVPGAGLGLFAKKALKSGTVISFYPAHILGIEVGDRIRRISLDGSTGQVEEQNEDADDDAPPKVDDAYLHHILGKRPLMHAGIAQDLGGAAMFLDVDMMRPESPGWDCIGSTTERPC